GLQEKITPSHRISSSKESSVPGSRHTATLRSSAEAKPRVGVLGKRVDTNLSPAFAGRDMISSIGDQSGNLLSAANSRRVAHRRRNGCWCGEPLLIRAVSFRSI